MRIVVSQLSENMIRLRSEVMELKRRMIDGANVSKESAREGEAAKGKAGEEDCPSPTPSSAVSREEIKRCVAEFMEGMKFGLSDEAARKILSEWDGKARRYTDDIANKLDARIEGIERRCADIEERIKAVVEPRVADLLKQAGISYNPKQIVKELWREGEADAGLIQSLKNLLHLLASCVVSVLITAFRILVFVGTLMAVILKLIGTALDVFVKKFDSKGFREWIYDHGTAIIATIMFGCLFAGLAFSFIDYCGKHP